MLFHGRCDDILRATGGLISASLHFPVSHGPRGRVCVGAVTSLLGMALLRPLMLGFPTPQFHPSLSLPPVQSTCPPSTIAPPLHSQRSAVFPCCCCLHGAEHMASTGGSLTCAGPRPLAQERALSRWTPCAPEPRRTVGGWWGRRSPWLACQWWADWWATHTRSTSSWARLGLDWCCCVDLLSSFWQFDLWEEPRGPEGDYQGARTGSDPL